MTVIDDSGPSVQVNGRLRALGAVGGHVTLLEWLRSVGLTGCKEGCAEGECGACSVLVARPDSAGGTDEGHTRWTAINACLVPAAGYAGQEVITAEGLGTVEALHPVQREMALRGGSQCGYCTPGFVCSMAAEYYRPDRTPVDEDPSAHQTADPDHEHGPNGFDLHALSGNLCRCTGYRPIRDAAYALDRPDADDPLAARMRRPAPAVAATTITDEQGEYVRPDDLADALRLLADHPEAQLVAGSTDWGVELNIRHRRAPLTVAVDRLPELRRLAITDERIELGAALTLSEIERGLAGRVPLLAELFPQFASRLIRNGATLGGNLGTGSPIGDSPPALLALEARLVLASVDGEREVALADYFTGYRQTVRRPGELIARVLLPRPLAAHTAFHKIAKRRFDDISSVAVAFALDLGDGVVERLRIGLGGVAATPIRALATEQMLTGTTWSLRTVRDAAEQLAAEGTPLDDHRASAAYRTAMLRTSLIKFFHRTDVATRGGRS